MPVGVDIVQISRIQKAMRNAKFADKILTQAETQQGTHNSIQSTPASFAAKETFSKALGTGMRGFDFGDISVLHNRMGKPYMQFSQKVADILSNHGVCGCELSISHEKDYAIATVILEYNKEYNHYNSALKIFDNCTADEAITPSMISGILPRRVPELHKGDCGRLFLLAGSVGLTGAAIMASRAALRCGAGLITLGCANTLNNIFECCLTEVMTLPLEDTNGVINTSDIQHITARAKSADCVLAGPGLTNCNDIATIVGELIHSCNKTLVLDADGINVLAQNINILKPVG